MSSYAVASYGPSGRFGTYGGMPVATFAYGAAYDPVSLAKQFSHGVQYLKETYRMESLAVRLQIASAAMAARVPGAAEWFHELNMEAGASGAKAQQERQEIEEMPSSTKEYVLQKASAAIPWKLIGGLALLGAAYFTVGRRRNPSQSWGQFFRELAKLQTSSIAFLGGTALAIGGLAGASIGTFTFPAVGTLAGATVVALGLTLAGAGYEGLTGQKTDIAGLRGLLGDSRKRNPRRSKRRTKGRRSRFARR